VQQVIDSRQPVLNDRASSYLRLIEYFDRRLFLADNNEQREQRMREGIAKRRESLQRNLLLGHSDKDRGQEFLRMLEDY